MRKKTRVDEPTSATVITLVPKVTFQLSLKKWMLVVKSSSLRDTAAVKTTTCMLGHLTNLRLMSLNKNHLIVTSLMKVLMLSPIINQR